MKAAIVVRELTPVERPLRCRMKYPYPVPGYLELVKNYHINLFQFYVWSDLSQPTIQTHPCYAEIGHRVIDNVVNRLRDSLRK